MKHNTFYVFGLLLFSLAVPSLLSAQNLIANGSFAEAPQNKDMFSTDVIHKTGVWSAVKGEWGWQQVFGSNGQSYAAVIGPQYTAEGSAAKGLVQSVADKKQTKGLCTLSLNYFIRTTTASVEGNYIEVSVFGFNGNFLPAQNLHATLKKEPKLTLLANKKLPDTGSVATWMPVSIDVNLGAGYDVVIVEFFGSGLTGEAGVDDVALQPKSGSASKGAVASKLIVPAPVPAAKPAPAPAPAAKPQPAAVAKPAPEPVPAVKPLPVAAAKPAPEPVMPPSVSAPILPRPMPVPVRPPVDNLILNGDFSTASLALPTTTGDTTAELSGRWLRSVSSPWEISPYGGNLGPYVRAAASREGSRLLYVASDGKRSQGRYLLRFDYLITDPSDVLGVKVFVSDRDITVGTDGGDFRMNNTQRPGDLVMLPAAAGWTAYHLPVELGNGYNYVYVLFMGSGNGNTGIDNVSLSPQRR